MFEKTQEKSINNINKYLARLFILRIKPLLYKQTDPKLVGEILNALQMQNFKARDNNINSFLKQMLSQPLPTQSIIDKLINIILENEPLYTLLSHIQKLQLISNEELIKALPTINLQIHLLCLFEAFSITMLNSKTFNEDIYNFILKLRHSPMPGHPIVNFMFASGSDFSFFKNMKIVAVDPVMTNGAFCRSLDNLNCPLDVGQKAQQFIDKYNLYWWNAKIDPYKIGNDDSVKNIGLNMIWAICGKGGHNDTQRRNSQAGCGLIAAMETLKYRNKKTVKSLLIPPDTNLDANNNYSLLPGLQVDQGKKVIGKFYMSKEWMDLYSSWDLLFLLDEFDSVFLPIKLLAPSILGAEPKHYIESRVFLLFLMGNLYQACKTEQHPLFASQYKFSQSERIMDEWSRINDQLVNTMLYKNCPGFQLNTTEIYNKVIGETPSLSLVSYIASFALDYEKFSITEPRPLMSECTKAYLQTG